MKLLNLNIYRSKCIDEVIAFINENQFDVIQLQEVGGKSFTFSGVDTFAKITQETGLLGEMFTMWSHKGRENGYFGNATFYKPSLQLKERIDLPYKPFIEMEPELVPVKDHPKGALFLCLESDRGKFWCINTHLAWGPTPFDEPYKIVDAKLLAKQISSLHHPFVLSGDFNVVSDTEVVRLLEPLGRNLTREYGFTNTLNPKLHIAKHLFPKGLAVDFVFTHPSIHVVHYKKVDDRNLSDHIGLIVEFYL